VGVVGNDRVGNGGGGRVRAAVGQQDRLAVEQVRAEVVVGKGALGDGGDHALQQHAAPAFRRCRLGRLVGDLDRVVGNHGVGHVERGVLGSEGAAQAGALIGGRAVVERDHVLQGGGTGELHFHGPTEGGPARGGHRHVVVESDGVAADTGGGVDVQGGATDI